MKLWPFGREKRTGYSDTIVAALTASAEGTSTVRASATGALEACAGFVGRAFASADVQASDLVRDVLTPSCLGHVGRQLIRRGDVLLLISTRGGRLALHPATDWTVYGAADPQTWTYEVTVSGASTTDTWRGVSREAVVHLMYAFSPWEPWRGVGPLTVAQLAGRLSAETVGALADEAAGPRGSFLSVPVDGADPTIVQMREDVKNARGRMLAAQGGDWGAGPSGGPAYWVARRFGAEPGGPLVDLARHATVEVFAACGLSTAMFDDSDGTSKRESYRQALHGCIAPLGRIVADELSRKLDETVMLDWQELRAGDIAGRARAFQSMVGAGMDPAKAAALAGLMVAD